MATRAAPKHRKRLVLLDAHAIIHRAYHALPDFSSSKGEPTGALYGLITMLLKIVVDLRPDYLAAAFDLPEPTHRHKEYAAYKATRAKAPDDLVAQLIRARSVFEAFGIPIYEAPGFEADDVLGTIVKQLSSKKDADVVIASGDLDTLQLVTSAAKVYTLRKGMQDTVMYDEQAVRDRYGFPPELIPDYKGLRGDPSDNIKGVAGIGEKTASELVSKFGTLEHILKTVREDPQKMIKTGIKPRVLELLAKGQSDAKFSKMLSTIRTDAPIRFSLPAGPWRMEEYRERILSLCDELEFRSLRERLRTLFAAAPAAEAEEQPEEKISVDPRELAETAIALWLLSSDTTNPTLGDIFAFAKLPPESGNFKKARTAIFAELRKTGRLQEVFERIEKPLIPVIERMNDDGVLLDTAYLKELAAEYNEGLHAIAERIYKAAGREFNISSPRQLAVVLFDELKLSLPRHRKTPGGARTTREDELAKMIGQHPIVADVLSYRELQKLLSTYIEKMPGMVGEGGRLHAEFLQAGTTTGRLASRNPNLQNIPIKSEWGKRIRSAFAAPRGFALAALDYSQIELRVAAGLSGDKKLLAIFENGEDIHAAVAAHVFGVSLEHVDYEMRRRAKVINFGILYGMGVNALKENLGAGVSREEAAAFLSAYFKKYTGLALWIEKTKLDAARRGFTETLFGRRRHFPGFKSLLPALRAQAERMAVNAPLQGTQADIIKLAMIRADELIEKNKWRDKVRLILQVHDELVYEIEKNSAERIAKALRHVMESVVQKKEMHGVPIIADLSIGPNWGSLKKIPR